MIQRKDHSELMYRLILENISDTVIITDDQGNIIYVCPNTTNTFGLSVDQVHTHKTIQRLMNGTVCDISELKKQNEITNIEWSIENSHGQKRFLLINVKSVSINGGTALYVMRDITDRIRYEERLKKYRNIVSSTTDGIAFLDENYKYLIINDAYEKFSGMKKEKLIGLTIAEYLGKDVFEKHVKPNFDRCLQGDIINYQNWFNYPALGRRYVDVTYSPYKDDDNRIVGVIANTRDITETKQSLDKIEFQAKLLHSVGQAVITTDKDGTIIYLNNAAEDLYGWPATEAIGKSITEVIVPDDSTAQWEQIMKTLQSGKFWSGEFLAKNRSARIFPVSVYDQPILDENGKLIAMIGISSDITERKQNEILLQRSQKMEAIGTLAGGIAHDFNNMLGIIIGNISYALSILNRDDELFDVLSDVMQGIKQAQNLTYQLLTFAKGGEPVKKNVNINELLEKSAKFVTSGSRSRCEMKLADDLWTAEVDPGQINQVVGNLLINADQAMPNGGIITIQTKNIEIKAAGDFQLSAGRYIKISIEDQGIGIQREHIPNIFDPYFTTKHKGRGLGLATAYSIIKRHDGNIKVYSELGKGTVFNIYIPAFSEGVVETRDKEEQKHQGHGRILIMDDQEAILRMVERMLNRMGYETESATDGTKAIELYRQAYESDNPFDLVILDLTVPGGMGGAKTITELLKINPEVMAVVSSGYSNDPIMANYQDYGFCGVVPKPYTKEQISDLLDKIFGEKT